MPYLSFRDAANKPVELSGNNLEQFKAAIEKNCKVAHVDLALNMVKTFFDLRNIRITRQKAEQAEDEDAEEAAYQQIPTFEKEEAAAREKYYDTCAGKIKPAEAVVAAPVAATVVDNSPYGKAAASERKVVEEDDFM